MTLQIKEVQTKRDLRKFIFLPEKIHKNHKNWVPPVYMDEWDFFNPKKNSSYRHCSSILFLALRDNKPVGRIMGIINHKYNKTHGENNARFFDLECWEDPEVAFALTKRIEEWARQEGMVKIIGPLGFSDKDPQGFMIEGFEYPMVVATNCSLPFMPELIEKCGYTREVDLFSYKLEIPEGIPRLYNFIYQRANGNGEFTMKEFTTKKELRKYIRPVFQLINEAYAEIYGFAELEADEMDFFANRYMFILNPKYVKIILNKKNEIAAFIISMPEMAGGIIKARGRMLPFGFLKVLKEGRKTKMLTLYLGAIKEEYRNNGLDALLGIKILETAQKEGMEYIDSHLILETNIKMRGELEKLGGKIYKKYRIYQKKL